MLTRRNENRRKGERRGLLTAPRDPSRREQALHLKLIHLLRAFGYVATSLRKRSENHPDPVLTKMAAEVGESSVLVWDARRDDPQVQRDVEFAAEQRLNILIIHLENWDQPSWWKLDIARHYHLELLKDLGGLSLAKVFYIPHFEDPATVATTSKVLSMIIEQLRGSQKLDNKTPRAL